MTWALCLNCGNTKFGAIVPCPHCGVASCGDMNVNIAFSDHRLSEASLKALGDVIKSLAPHAHDESERFWAFMRYVSLNHPRILTIKLSPEGERRCDEILAQASPPAVSLEPSPRSQPESDGKKEPV